MILGRVTEILILARNDFVRSECQDTFKRRNDRSENLTVFCVSSREHQEHLHGYDAFETPMLSIQTTEIPALRTYLRSLPAKIRYRIFAAHCHTKIPSVLNAVEMSCSLNGPERKANWSNLISQTGQVGLHARLRLLLTFPVSQSQN